MARANDSFQLLFIQKTDQIICCGFPGVKRFPICIWPKWSGLHSDHAVGFAQLLCEQLVRCGWKTVGMGQMNHLSITTKIDEGNSTALLNTHVNGGFSDIQWPTDPYRKEDPAYSGLEQKDSPLPSGGRERRYAVVGQLFFVSVTYFKAGFDLHDHPERVVIDLHEAHLWGQSGVAALDQVIRRYRSAGSVVDVCGLNPASADLFERIGASTAAV